MLVVSRILWLKFNFHIRKYSNNTHYIYVSQFIFQRFFHMSNNICDIFTNINLSNMKAQSLIIVVLSVALLFAVIKIVTSRATTIAGNAADAVINNIMTRTSIRSFTDESLTGEQIETLLKAGMAAPSAVNKQPWKFIVVKNCEVLKRIADTLPNTRLTTATCAIVVCGDMTKTLDGVARDFWIHDCSAATENILLAAHAMGVGAVWAGIFPNPDRVSQLRGLIDIPETLVPLCVVALGHPAENPEPKDKWKTENYMVIE